MKTSLLELSGHRFILYHSRFLLSEVIPHEKQFRKI